MELYRCFFLDETAAVFGRTEFHATNDGDAEERAALHTRMHAAARGTRFGRVADWLPSEMPESSATSRC